MTTKTIGINTRLWMPGKLEGIGRFTKEVASRLAHIRPHNRFVFYFDQKVDLAHHLTPNVTTKVVLPPARRPLLWSIWFQKALPLRCKKDGIDLLISLENYLPLHTPFPTIATVHDLNFIHFPDFIQKNYRKYVQSNFPKFSRAADRVVTVSEFCKADIIQQLQICSEKIAVVKNGISSVFKHPQSHDLPTKIKAQISSTPYILHIGAIHPRKNLVHQLKAFAQLKAEINHPLKFVIAGKRMFDDAKLESFLKDCPYSDEVLFLGFVDDTTLSTLLQKAVALSFVSLFEGFGLPIVEAMSVGCPVITSNTSALPEIAGDAAWLVDPNDIEALKQAYKILLTQPNERSYWIEQGRIHSEAFSWEKTAAVYSTLIEELL